MTIIIWYQRNLELSAALLELFLVIVIDVGTCSSATSPVSQASLIFSLSSFPNQSVEFVWPAH
jgi:hypothetical protein